MHRQQSRRTLEIVTFHQGFIRVLPLPGLVMQALMLLMPASVFIGCGDLPNAVGISIDSSPVLTSSPRLDTATKCCTVILTGQLQQLDVSAARCGSTTDVRRARDSMVSPFLLGDKNW